MLPLQLQSNGTQNPVENFLSITTRTSKEQNETSLNKKIRVGENVNKPSDQDRTENTGSTESERVVVQDLTGTNYGSNSAGRSNELEFEKSSSDPKSGQDRTS